MTTDPDFHFPGTLCQQGQKELEIFFDYGSIENLAIRPSTSKPCGYYVVTQRDHWKDGWPVAPLFPAIPFTPPNPVPSSVKEPVMHSVIEFRKMLRKMILFLRQSRTRCRTKPVRAALSSRLQSIRLSAAMPSHSERTTEERASKYKHIYLNSINMHIPQLVEMSHNILKRNINTEDINSEFCGGCVAYESWPPMSRMQSSSVGFTAFPSGAQLNQLSICAVEVTTDLRLRVKERLDLPLCDAEPTESTRLTNYVYEVTTNRVKGRCFCACRMERNCFVYEVTPTNDGLNTTQISSHCFSTEEKPLSIALNPYSVCECIIATDQGNIYLLEAESIQTICCGLKPRFESWVKWFRCFFSSNPRLLIVADRCGISQIDCKGEPQTSELFTLPSEHLSESERIMMISPVRSRPHYYLVSTALSIILLDDRCPNQPILRWAHTFPSSPVYFSSFSLDDHTVIAACDQEGSASLFYRVKFSRNGLPPLSAGTPYRAAKTCDFMYLLSSPQASFNHITVNERIDVPLAGICVVPLKNSFILLQATGFGDVFHQAFTNTLVDTTTMLPEMSTWCIEWYRDLEKILRRSRCVNCNMCDIDIDCIISMLRIPLPHVLCPFCMAKNWAMRRPFIENVREYFAGMSCYACSHTLIESAAVTLSSKESRIADNLSSVNFSLLKLKEVCAEKAPDPFSRLLVKLWKGEKDIGEELEARDALEKERYTQLLSAPDAESSAGNLSFDFDEHSSDPDNDPSDDDVPGTTNSPHNEGETLQPGCSTDVVAEKDSPLKSRKHKRKHSGSSAKSSISARSNRSAITAFPGFLAGPKQPGKRLSSPNGSQLFSPPQTPKKKRKFTLGF